AIVVKMQLEISEDSKLKLEVFFAWYVNYIFYVLSTKHFTKSLIRFKKVYPAQWVGLGKSKCEAHGGCLVLGGASLLLLRRIAKRLCRCICFFASHATLLFRVCEAQLGTINKQEYLTPLHPPLCSSTINKQNK
ncbi:MAG TPA: hypothetical protein VK174_09645, partial [Chitinophagales bacterium]|nr:hypothetical protein [Chitinophagales bacterium]